MANKYDKIRNEYNTKGLSKGILTGVKRAIRKSATSTRTVVRRELRKSLGLSSKRINKRVLLNKPASGLTGRHSLKGGVAVATQFFMPMRYFKPKSKIVRTTVKGVKRKVKRIGVTTKIGKRPRMLVPNAFIMEVKGNTIVAERKTSRRKPTKEVFTKVFQTEVEKNSRPFQKILNNKFTKIVNNEIDFAVTQRLKKG